MQDKPAESVALYERFVELLGGCEGPQIRR
jgi:hypothetical protein